MHNHYNRLQLPERALAQLASSSFSPPSSVSVYFSPPSSVFVFSLEASGNMNLVTHFPLFAVVSSSIILS